MSAKPVQIQEKWSGITVCVMLRRENKIMKMIYGAFIALIWFLAMTIINSKMEIHISEETQYLSLVIMFAAGIISYRGE